MKKIMTLALGLSLVVGSGVLAFAQTDKGGTSTSSTPKKAKKTSTNTKKSKKTTDTSSSTK